MTERPNAITATTITPITGGDQNPALSGTGVLVGRKVGYNHEVAVGNGVVGAVGVGDVWVAVAVGVAVGTAVGAVVGVGVDDFKVTVNVASA
jgi:hypothetical protein